MPGKKITVLQRSGTRNVREKEWQSCAALQKVGREKELRTVCYVTVGKAGFNFLSHTFYTILRKTNCQTVKGVKTQSNTQLSRGTSKSSRDLNLSGLFQTKIKILLATTLYPLTLLLFLPLWSAHLDLHSDLVVEEGAFISPAQANCSLSGTIFIPPAS